MSPPAPFGTQCMDGLMKHLGQVIQIAVYDISYKARKSLATRALSRTVLCPGEKDRPTPTAKLCRGPASMAGSLIRNKRDMYSPSSCMIWRSKHGRFHGTTWRSSSNCSLQHPLQGLLICGKTGDRFDNLMPLHWHWVRQHRGPATILAPMKVTPCAPVEVRWRDVQ